MRLNRAIACAIVLGSALPAAAQDPVTDFYRSRQVAITVGFGSGGSASLYSQVLARHMSRHMPGNPNFVVQHMPGAGGLLVTNNSANNAPNAANGSPVRMVAG